jgi:hypothetical protein
VENMVELVKKVGFDEVDLDDMEVLLNSHKEEFLLRIHFNFRRNIKRKREWQWLWLCIRLQAKDWQNHFA